MEHNKDNVKLGEVKYKDKTFLRCRWGITNKHLWNTLNNLGCTPRKSLTLQFPNISEKLEIPFIRGYFDGDGCLSYYQKTKILPKASFLGTRQFLVKIQAILNNFNIKSSLVKDSRMENTLVLNISSTNSLDFLDLVYSNSSIYLDRKYKRYKIFKTCRSKQECLELLAGENGEGCDVNLVVNEDSNESSSL